MDSADWDPDWARIRKIYHSALRLPCARRSAYIARACQYDPALISELNSRLAANGACDNQLPSEPEDTLVGQVIDGRYFVEGVLGEGGMGRVYLALNQRLNQLVVIKTLLHTSKQNPDLVQRFKQEAVALSRIRHSCVIGISDANELPDGTPYIVLEYVDGENLRSQVSPEGMNLKRVAQIVQEIGDALDHVHEKGIFHRDLKPENIMIERDTASVKIVDFGVAKVKDSGLVLTTNKQAEIGTFVYMSPEQIRGDEIGAASDIYSMAVVAYEMITGQRPANPAVREQVNDLRPDLSSEAHAVLLKALSINPQSRYATAGEFGRKLASALSVRRSPKSLRPIVMTGIGVVALSLLSFGIYKYINRKPEPSFHAFRYWLTVQPTRAGQDYDQPFKSFGEETFASGDKFQLNVSADEPGYLYVFNQGPSEPAITSFTLIYPNQITNSGSAAVGANQPVQSGWITFRGPPGAENFWIVWSASPIAELEAAKAEAFKHPAGGLTDRDLVAVREFLKGKEAEIKVRIARYNASQSALVSGRSELLIAHVEFKHR